MKKQLFSVVAALAFGSVVAQTPSPSWSISQNASFTVAAAGTRYLDAVDQNVVWTAGYDGFNANFNYNWYSKTTNGGTSFTSGNIFSDTNTYVLSNMEGIDANTCWVAAFTKSLQAQGAIYQTTNGGTTWTNMTAPGMFTNTASFANVVSFFTPSNGVVMGDPVNGEFEIWTTSNGGTSWSLVPGANIPNPIASEFGIVDLYDKQGTGNMWFGTNKGRIYYTNNAGSTWSVSTVGPNTYTVTEIAFASATNGLAFVAVGTNSTALFNTIDGGVTWNFVNTTDPDLGRNDLCGIPGTNNFASVDNQNQVISFSTDNGLTWTSWGGTGIPYLKVDFVDVNTAWAGSFSDQTTPSIGGIWKYAGVTANFSIPTNVCKTSASVTATPVNMSTGAGLTYSWSAVQAGVSFSSPTATNPAITFTANGAYTIRLAATNSLGVVVTNTQVINVLTCSSPTANFNIPASVCNNVAFTLTNASTGVPAPTFTITTSATSGVTVTPASGPSTVSIKFAAPGIYTITSSASSIGGTGVTTKTINIQDCSPIAGFSLNPASLCLDGTVPSSTVLASNTSTGTGVTYVWSSNPSATSFTNATGNSRRYTYNTPGTYTITLTASNVSGTTTAVQTLSVTDCTATGLVKNSALADNLTVYPNPAHEQLNISLPASNEVFKIKLVNLVGAVVFEEKTAKNSKETVINLTGKAKGVYFLSVESGAEKAVKKIIVE